MLYCKTLIFRVTLFSRALDFRFIQETLFSRLFISCTIILTWEILAWTLFSRVTGLANLRENKLLANKKCFTVYTFRTSGSVPLFGTCVCSNCWGQLSRTWRAFTRLITLNIPRYFSILLSIVFFFLMIALFYTVGHTIQLCSFRWEPKIQSHDWLSRDIESYLLIKMKTMYKHVVDTPQSRVKRGMKRVSSDAKKEKKRGRNMIFSQVAKVCLFKRV